MIALAIDGRLTNPCILIFFLAICGRKLVVKELRVQGGKRRMDRLSGH
jgi:hypothetical protein